jgi:hypothetical protein
MKKLPKKYPQNFQKKEAKKITFLGNQIALEA